MHQRNDRLLLRLFGYQGKGPMTTPAGVVGLCLIFH